MYVVVRNYAVTSLYRDAKGGFNADIEQSDGRYFTLNFSTITLKFYKNGSNAKLPQYLCKEVLEMAISKGIVFMNQVERENVIWGMKK